MRVSDVISDLEASLAQFPEAGAYRVGVAAYTEGPGSDINVMYIGSYEADLDGDFLLVPEGMGPAFELEESELTARQLREALGERAEWANFPAYVRSAVIKFPDGSVASRNQPLWGAGMQHEAKLVYFYYGAFGADS